MSILQARTFIWNRWQRWSNSFICKQGAFGGADGGYAYGKVITEIRKGIDEQCPLGDINL